MINKEKLKIELLKHNLSFGSLAEKLSINQSTLSRKFASGNFTRDELMIIADIIGKKKMLEIFLKDEEKI